MNWRRYLRRGGWLLVVAVFTAGAGWGEEPHGGKLVALPGLFAPLTEPPCSYCSTQHRKRLIPCKIWERWKQPEVVL